MDSVGYLIWELSNLSRVLLEARLEVLDLTCAQMGTLKCIDANPAISMADVARQIHMTPQNLSLIVAKLERAGLVERAAHQTHGRIQTLKVTPRGRVRMLAALDHAHTNDDALLAGFTAAERKSLPSLLRRCLANAAEPVAAPPAPRRSPKKALPTRAASRRPERK